MSSFPQPFWPRPLPSLTHVPARPAGETAHLEPAAFHVGCDTPWALGAGLGFPTAAWGSSEPHVGVGVGVGVGCTHVVLGKSHAWAQCPLALIPPCWQGAYCPRGQPGREGQGLLWEGHLTACSFAPCWAVCPLAFLSGEGMSSSWSLCGQMGKLRPAQHPFSTSQPGPAPLTSLMLSKAQSSESLSGWGSLALGGTPAWRTPPTPPGFRWVWPGPEPSPWTPPFSWLRAYTQRV